MALVVNVALFVAGQLRTEDFDNAWLALDRNELYGLPAEIDGLADGSRVLTIGHPTMEYPAAGARRANRVIASPRGDLDAEIDEWSADYVLVRLPEDDLATIAANGRLVVRGEHRLLPARWWDALGEPRPLRTVLFEVVQ
jgi:hypothetical protein